MTLTVRQAQALAFIKSHLQATGGIAPTFAEIGMGLGLASKGSVAQLVDQLVLRGFLTKTRGLQQSLALTQPRAPAIPATFYPCERGVVSRVGRRISIRRAA